MNGWTTYSPPLSSGWVWGSLGGVWSSNASHVYVVGMGSTTARTTYSYLPLIYHYGGAWTSARTDLPSGWTKGGLNDVWGSTPDDVYAVGWGQDSNGYILPLVYHYDGDSWTNVSLPCPADELEAFEQSVGFKRQQHLRGRVRWLRTDAP